MLQESWDKVMALPDAPAAPAASEEAVKGEGSASAAPADAAAPST